MKTLRQVGVGQTVTVKRLHGEGPVKRRIMDMGITKGVQIYVRKVAPLGDPIEVTVRDYELSLRKVDVHTAKYCTGYSTLLCVHKGKVTGHVLLRNILQMLSYEQR